MANGVCCVPKLGIKGSSRAERKVQALVAVEERPIRVVEEVVTGETELKLFALRLSESEILEQRHVRVKESWTRQCRENVGTLLAGRGKRREAGTVDVLVRLEAASRIAGQPRH